MDSERTSDELVSGIHITMEPDETISDLEMRLEIALKQRDEAIGLIKEARDYPDDIAGEIDEKIAAFMARVALTGACAHGTPKADVDCLECQWERNDE